jgi:hypothetical protein
MSDCWGVSIHFDLHKCANIDLISNPDKLVEWCNSLVEAISMKKYGEPAICKTYHFGVDNKEGWTLVFVQLIETSNITLTIHCNDSTADCYLDLFTCKLVPNLEYIVEQHLFQWFQCKTLSSTKINRLA